MRLLLWVVGADHDGSWSSAATVSRRLSAAFFLAVVLKMALFALSSLASPVPFRTIDDSRIIIRQAVVRDFTLLLTVFLFSRGYNQ